MNESEKASFRDITDHYGEHDIVRSLNDVLQNAQSIAHRLQAAGEYEGIVDERDAALIAQELGKRLDAYASEHLAELIDSTIIIRASADVGQPTPVVIIISEGESGAIYIEDTPLENEASAAGMYVGLDFEVRKVADGYAVRPMIIIEAPSLNYADKESTTLSAEAYMMVPLDCERYSYTEVHDSDSVKQEGKSPEARQDKIDLAGLLHVCLDIEKELNWGEYSQDTYDECYGKLQCYLEEHGLAQDTEVMIAMFAGSLGSQGTPSEFIDGRAIIEKPTITREDEQWYVQLQFSLWQESKRGYELYGTSPRSILSIEAVTS